MKRTASAEWKGNISEGKGAISTQSGVLENTQYSFATRFADGKGTNPEELVAAAHAGCFAMAFSLMLGEAGFTADSIRAQAAVTLEKKEGGFMVTSSHLDVKARIPGIENEKFQEIAANAKQNCPISKLLNTEITMLAALD